MIQKTVLNTEGDQPTGFTEWCAATKQVIDRRSAADGCVRMVHTRQHEAIDCPSTPDLTLVLIVAQEIALPTHQYDFGFGKIQGRPTVGSLALLPHGISTAKTGGGPYESLNVSIDFRDLQERFEIAGIKAPDDFGILHSKLWRDDPIERLVLELWKDGNDTSPAGLLYSDSLYCALLARLMMLAEQPISELPVHATLTDDLVQLVEQHMRDHLEEKIPLEDLAEVVGYSRFHFSRLFKAATGETANHFLMRLRVEKAVMLIRDVGLDLTLAQVAAACGFSDQSHLTRQFRLQMGVTPAKTLFLLARVFVGSRCQAFNKTGEHEMSTNLSVTYSGTRELEVVDLPVPKREFRGKTLEHAVILKVIATNICGSDQHIYHGRFDVPKGTVLGHEITGEVVEIGRDVEMMEVGDIVSVPFNVCCGKCRNCTTQHPEICETVNENGPIGAYGFDLGGWQGGQAQFCLVPYADFALLKFPDRDQAMDRMLELAFLSDILPTGYHGCVSANVKPGSTVYVAGAGPVGRCAAAGARLLGAACVIIGDQNKERLAVMEKAGYETADLSSTTPLADQIDAILGVPEVDCGVDAVGYEAHGLGEHSDEERPEAALNSMFDVVRAGGSIGIPGIYVGGDPGSSHPRAKNGTLDLALGAAWTKSLTLTTGMAPVRNYSRELMQAILWNRIDLPSVMNTEVVPIEKGPDAYAQFSAGSSKKFVIDPNGMLKK